MAHPLLDRRDLTAQRELPAPAAPDRGPAPHGFPVLEDLVRRLLEQDRAELRQLCVTDREPAQSTMRDFPVPGVVRRIVRRTGQGGLVNLAAGTPALLVAANEARLGGQIVVSGAGAVVLYLAADLLTPGGGAPLGEGAAQIYLTGTGGSWDFQLGPLLWCGNVIAVAQATSAVTVAEV